MMSAQPSSVSSKEELKIFHIYRYHPTNQPKPIMQSYQLNITGDMMLLDALRLLQDQDDSLAFRRSCREGVCGSDGMNINGKNRLACITPLSALSNPITIRPLPGMPVIRDLVVDLSQFYQQYRKVKPFLMTSEPHPAKERLQSPEDRSKLDGLYECILCACCSTSCPSFWWNPEKFIGPAGLLQAWRFLADTRDEAKSERLKGLQDPFSVFRCRGIMNCVDVCPKGLNPTKAISAIRMELVEQND